MNRRGFLSLAGATLALTGAGSFTMRSAQAQSGFALTVLHINDMHSRIGEISKYNSSCSDDDSAEGNASAALPVWPPPSATAAPRMRARAARC